MLAPGLYAQQQLHEAPVASFGGGMQRSEPWLRDNGKENGNYRDYRVYVGLYWGYIGGLYDTIPPKIPPGL